MKNFRAIGVMIMLGLLPVLVSAKKAITVNRLVLTAVSSGSEIDSLPKIKRQDDKDKKKGGPEKDQGQKPDVKPEVEPKRPEVKRPDIREVPKSRPKLRPGAVTDRVKIKRPPVKVKPGRGRLIAL
jgi:hypothetical protein